MSAGQHVKVLRLCVAIAMSVAISGCAPPSVRAAERPGTTDPKPIVSVDKPLNMAVFGDSITSWAPPYAGDPAQSWVNTATADIPLVCGWAKPGAKLTEMAARAEPCSAYFLVMMGGTNDLYAGTPVGDRLAALDAIAATVDAEHVMVLAIAPYGFDWAEGAQWNQQLAEHASTRGWMFLDPWAASGARSADGTWTSGADFGDDIHPSPESASRVAVVVRDALLFVHLLTA